jgi:hypothetical protein
MRTTSRLTWLACLSALAVVGCRSTSEAERTAGIYPMPTELAGYRQTTLLFDPTPGALSAEAFTRRSNWPVAYGPESLGERTYYVEYYCDYFSPYLHGRDDFTRIFRSYRVGELAR